MIYADSPISTPVSKDNIMAAIGNRWMTMSPLGPKRRSRNFCSRAAVGGKADVPHDEAPPLSSCGFPVRFGDFPNSGFLAGLIFFEVLNFWT
jgi:hypothetical protein